MSLAVAAGASTAVGDPFAEAVDSVVATAILGRKPVLHAGDALQAQPGTSSHAM